MVTDLNQSTNSTTGINYKQIANSALKLLRRDRDRQILAKRFGFGLAKRQTLEKIGRDFGITRERVRQIEKAATAKLKTAAKTEVAAMDSAFVAYLTTMGGVATATAMAAHFGAESAGDQAYILFLAELTPSIETIEESDRLLSGFGVLPTYTTKHVRAAAAELIEVVKAAGKPISASKAAANMPSAPAANTVGQIADISKDLAALDGKIGLISWPSVNPKSIRDKTFLVLGKHGKPLHFSDIAEHIHQSGFSRRKVTVQAVHNELIKDSRFVLIGRGIYALSDWGYTPGTVADIITEILRQQAPLHKDEIVRRVLEKRQVKTTTIVLNLQEKSQFERVAKATYRLTDS